MKGARIILGLACAAMIAAAPVPAGAPVERVSGGVASVSAERVSRAVATASAAARDRGPAARPSAAPGSDVRASQLGGKGPFLVFGEAAVRAGPVECTAAGGGLAAALCARVAGSRGGAPRAPPVLS